MSIKSFYKNQREIASALNDIIDAYWNDELAEKLMIEHIGKIYANNEDKIVKDGQFTKILQQQCGKKRLDVIDKIVNK